ncbi:hypothetical protein ACPA9J_35960 [Pseudomonas aeruginosa]
MFWINLPIALLALAISRRTLSRPAGAAPATGDRLPASCAMVVGLTAPLLAITQIGQGAAWSDPCAARPVRPGGARPAAVRRPGAALPRTAGADATVRRPRRHHPQLAGCVLRQLPGHLADRAGTAALPERYRRRRRQRRAASAAAGHGPAAGRVLLRAADRQPGTLRPLILLGAVLLPCGIAGLALVPVGDHWLSGLCMLLTGIAIGTQFPTSLVAAQNAVEQRHIGVATSNATLFRSSAGRSGWR